MHEPLGADDIAAEDIADALMAETDTEQRDAPAELPDDLIADPGLFRRAGTRGNADMIRFELRNLLDGHLIIAPDFHERPHLAEVLDEVVGKRIVVVDDEQHGKGGSCLILAQGDAVANGMVQGDAYWRLGGTAR